MRRPSQYKLKNTLDLKRSGDGEIESARKVDVTEMLKENLARQRKHEKPIDLKKPKSRKKRDYVLGMIFVNSALIVPFFILEQNIVTGVFTLSGVVIFGDVPNLVKTRGGIVIG